MATGSVPHAGKLLLMMMRSMESLLGEQLEVYTALRVQTLLALLWDGGGSPWIIPISLPG